MVVLTNQTKQIKTGRILTVLSDWVKDNIKEEKLSYIALKDLHTFFFNDLVAKDFEQSQCSLPVFGKLIRVVLKERGLYEKCTFRKRSSGTLIFGITLLGLEKHQTQDSKKKQDFSGSTEGMEKTQFLCMS